MVSTSRFSEGGQWLFAWILGIIFLPIGCGTPAETIDESSKAQNFSWDNASVYFLMTDRFYNGDTENDYLHNDDNPPAPYRGFMGGDIVGITQKIKDGYFSDLGIQAIWFTPVVEQIAGSVDEGTGNSYGFHGYWTRDWTALDPSFGTASELIELVKTAHEHGIRIIMDVVANHTGPVTEKDPVWPDEWVKTGPRCTYQDYASTVDCTLVENLPDIRTENEEEVELPPFLLEKWEKEGRKEREIAELDNWFEETGYARTAVNYVLKWLVDFIKEYGVDGFRVDTVKHTEAFVWKNLSTAARSAWADYKTNHPDNIIDTSTPFYLVGEVYNYYISGGRSFEYGDSTVDFYDYGFDALINFDFKTDAQNDYETIFQKYDRLLQGSLAGKSILNYISSHDDGGPFDLNRNEPIEAGTKLMLCPGGVQIYYGDETARSLTVEAKGDATLRSFMNWDELEENVQKSGHTTQEILEHWQKLGKFRQNHISVGAGKHTQLSATPYVFSREFEDDRVVIAIDENLAEKAIDVSGVFSDGTVLRDAYHGGEATVKEGKITLENAGQVVLLEIMN